MSESTNQYKYDEMSNKVLRTDKRLLDDGLERNIITTPQSLIGKISVKDLDSSNLESYNYSPTTPENNEIFDLILTWCSNQLDNDVPDDILRSLADILLEILKADTLNEMIKKSKIEDTLDGKLTDESFKEILSLSNEITDYNVQDNGDHSDEEGLGIVIDSEDEISNDEDNDNDEDHEASGEEDAPKGDDDNDSSLVPDNDDILKLSKENLDPKVHMIDIKSIDRLWLTRQIASTITELDSYKHAELSIQVFNLLKDSAAGKIDARRFENSLHALFDFDNNMLIQKIMHNQMRVYYGIILSESPIDEKDTIFNEMISKDLESLVNEYKGIRKHQDDDSETSHKLQRISETEKQSMNMEVKKPKYLDLDSLVFDKGSRFMTTSKFQLPQGSFKRTRKSWEEIHIPPPKQPELQEDERLVEISELPEWAQTVFPSSETKTLNRIQSKVYPTAFLEDSNILMCAPTGAGKTNVAMLSILRTISKFMDDQGHLDLNNFKIVYIAPLKALVQEQVREFQRRLNQFGITVNELTGDSNLTKHQIASTQIIVTTPEKWDVITRKMSDISYTSLVRLIIIDEIHLLHDERGPVIESIVARTQRNNDDSNDEPVRLVGLSATLPNYKDVAELLRVNESKGLFYFDASYRPCPLAQQFIGITEKKSLKRFQAMNEICYEKVVENVSKGHQVIIFVHSRKETEKTAKWITEKLIENEKLAEIIKFTPGVEEILRSESEQAKSEGLKSVIPMGFGIHHAGMVKQDRSTAEDLFAQGYLKVLVSTATLAWGVNLPAHTVIIKGTNVYSPEKGSWVELSPQDILQMLGRAGRPRYDTHGEGIIITAQDEVKYYLAILNQQLPIESQLISKLADNINAEIVAGTIQNMEDCVQWLSYTYLYVRMSRARLLYHIGPSYDADTDLTERRKDLAHSALTILAKNGLIKYDYSKDLIATTDLGKIASHYYISYRSMKNYDKQLKPFMTEIDIFRMFSTSEEFKYVPVRQEEKVELVKLMQQAPIPINESAEDPLAKINILLQAYISKLKLVGFALMSDMIYVVQSAGRLFRAMLEIAIKKKWSRLSKLLIDICKMVEKRLWLTNSPLRQFPNAPIEVIQITERSMTPWKHYLNLNDEYEVGQAFKSDRYGRLGFELLGKFPRISVETSIQPITSTLVKIEVEVLPQWVWDTSIHGYSQSFKMIIEDCDSEKILHIDTLVVMKEYVNQPHIIDCVVPLFDTTQPNYFVSFISDSWLHCETKDPIMLMNLIVPKKFPAPYSLMTIHSTPTSDLGIDEFSTVFPFENFNTLQSHVLNSAYNSQDNLLFCCSKGNGKTTVAELTLLNHWREEKGRAVYLVPTQEQVDRVFIDWKKRLSGVAGGKEINRLTGELSADLKLLGSSHLILATPEQFDLISRRWQQRRNIQSIELFIADDCHTAGSGAQGTIYEVVLSRMRFIAANLEKNIRIVALGSSIADSKNFGAWLGVPKQNIMNFDSTERVHPLEVKLHHSEITHHPSFVLAMIKSTYNAISEMDEDIGEDKAIVFVPSRKYCVDVSKELIKRLNKDDVSWLRTDLESIEGRLNKVIDLSLRESLKFGIGYYYKSMQPSDRSMVEKLFDAGALSCLLATKETSFWCPAANFVVVLSTQEYEGKEHRYIDYSLNELQEMVGLARLEKGTAKALIFTNVTRLEYYKKFLAESLPIESHLNFFLHDCFINEISTQLIKNRQDCVDWLTYSYFYRRLQMNPTYYNLHEVSEVGVSEYLSELIESTLNDLVEGKMIEAKLDDDDDDDDTSEDDEHESEGKIEITPLNGCMIAAYYNVSFITMQTFALSLNSKTKLRKLLEVVSSAYEFESIPIRKHENEFLAKLYNRLPVKSSSEPNFELPSFKAFLLLQAHFSRINLPPDLTSDLNTILLKIVNLLYAAVDILSSEGNLNAMSAMDLTQMVVQSQWDTDHPLKQIPYFENEIIAKCTEKKVETVYDIMALEDDEREEVMESLNDKQLNKVAEFVNKYPNLEISYELDLSEPIVANQPKEIVISIDRDEEAEDLSVSCSRYPFPKLENWWIVVGNQKTKQLFAIKKLMITKLSQQVKLSFTIPEAGEQRLSVWCMCDSYIDADKQIEITDVVVEAEAEE
ncbi:hypothetical protein CANARDRAFT_174242 [[Candida] arabinofermentans NRRL YB-2248]|uniref:RNA helicase n=1 Tax=[Candida] arabinofermentans NRRL YB-2248 TaxID=983967 RepID=A0A1E4T5W3_9ASCO|nr:hypothetical protein CANARDRAFT_174242 [[Candida] arabinofermentans NRRL YB-2248]